ncbi:MAG: hypothetical protein KGH53_03355 [Candidatus Micrarchaeota archaeon]|nr:hypothetical protein [Candidatus Micrarchaeota archaeon]
MENNPMDFLTDVIGSSKSTVRPLTPPNLDQSFQKNLAKNTLSPEDSVFASLHLVDIEATAKKQDRVIQEIGYIPGFHVLSANRSIIAQKMEEGFTQGRPKAILEAFNYHKLNNVEEITEFPRELANAIHEEYGEVDRSLIKHIKAGDVKEYTISTATEIAKYFSKFSIEACIVAAHEIKDSKLVAALHTLHREKIRTLPKNEKAKLKLR